LRQGSSQPLFRVVQRRYCPRRRGRGCRKWRPAGGAVWAERRAPFTIRSIRRRPLAVCRSTETRHLRWEAVGEARGVARRRCGRGRTTRRGKWQCIRITNASSSGARGTIVCAIRCRGTRREDKQALSVTNRRGDGSRAAKLGLRCGVGDTHSTTLTAAATNPTATDKLIQGRGCGHIRGTDSGR
jgi:hypothetical protein